MKTNPAFVLLTIRQLLHALLVSSAIAYPGQTYLPVMPVPADNVTVAGLASDVQLIDNNEQSGEYTDYIAPVNPEGIVAPTSTVEVTSTRLFIDPAPMYNVFNAPQY